MFETFSFEAHDRVQDARIFSDFDQWDKTHFTNSTLEKKKYIFIEQQLFCMIRNGKCFRVQNRSSKVITSLLRRTYKKIACFELKARLRLHLYGFQIVE